MNVESGRVVVVLCGLKPQVTLVNAHFTALQKTVVVGKKAPQVTRKAFGGTSTKRAIRCFRNGFLNHKIQKSEGKLLKFLLQSALHRTTPALD